jgi:hypothetical protein
MKTLEEIKKTLEEEKAHHDKAVNAGMVDENLANIEGWIQALEWVLK